MNTTTESANRRAMALSVAAGVLMLVVKVAAYLLTGSSAILSDAGESVIHLAAVGFAAFSLALSTRPASPRFPYGYERISFFSAGFEGALIAFAGISIIVAAVDHWISGLQIQRLGIGSLLVAAAGAVNGVLGWYLIGTGRRTGSLIVEANGQHVLTDAWTSLGVVGGLILVLVTGWAPLDPLVAIAVALNILWSGGRLVGRSISGLLDYTDPETDRRVGDAVRSTCDDVGVEHHAIRIRQTGQRLIIELHLRFPYDTALGDAHRVATSVEERLVDEFGADTEVVTHLEAREGHEEVHRAGHHPAEHLDG